MTFEFPAKCACRKKIHIVPIPTSPCCSFHTAHLLMGTMKWDISHIREDDCVDTREPHTPVSDGEYSILSIPATPDPWENNEPTALVHDGPNQSYSGSAITSVPPVTLLIADATVTKRERVSLVDALNFDRYNTRRLPFPSSQQVFTSSTRPDNGGRYQRHAPGTGSYHNTRYSNRNPRLDSEQFVSSAMLLQ